MLLLGKELRKMTINRIYVQVIERNLPITWHCVHPASLHQLDIFFFCIICQFSSSQRKKVQKKISTRQFCSNPKSERDCKDLVKGRERLWKNLKNQSVKFLATHYSSTSHNVDTLTCHLTTFPNVSCISTECLTLVVIKWPWIGLTFFLCKKKKKKN